VEEYDLNADLIATFGLENVEAMRRRYGRLQPLGIRFQRRQGAPLVAFYCRCDCGAEKWVLKKNLLNGTSSCGCATKGKRTRHGATSSGRRTPEYVAWRSMIQRCTQPGTASYDSYGGRGITICERWQGDEGFEHFLHDLGPKPSKNFSLDRIDNDGNYAPENVCWVKRELNIAESTLRLIEIDGVTKHLAQWVRECGISLQTFYHRTKVRGWDVTRALTTPPANNKKANNGG